MPAIIPPIERNPRTGRIFRNPQTLPGAGNSPGGSGDGGGSDWQHLMVRFGEFIIGVVLIWVGIQAIVVRGRGQTIIQTTGTVAKVLK